MATSSLERDSGEPTAIAESLGDVFYRLRSRGVYTRLEPDDGKLSSPVLRGGSGSNAAPLPDPLRWVAKDAHFPAAAREETSSPQKDAYTQRLCCFLEPDQFRGFVLGTLKAGFTLSTGNSFFREHDDLTHEGNL